MKETRIFSTAEDKAFLISKKDLRGEISVPSEETVFAYHGEIGWSECCRFTLPVNEQIFLIEILEGRTARRKISFSQIVVMEIGWKDSEQEKD